MNCDLLDIKVEIPTTYYLPTYLWLNKVAMFVS